MQRVRNIQLESDGDAVIQAWDTQMEEVYKRGPQCGPIALVAEVRPQDLAKIGVHYLPDEERADLAVVKYILCERLRKRGYSWGDEDDGDTTDLEIWKALEALMLPGGVRPMPDPIEVILTPKWMEVA